MFMVILTTNKFAKLLEKNVPQPDQDLLLDFSWEKTI